MSFRFELSELIGASEAVAIAEDCGSTLGRYSFRRMMFNYLEQKGQYRLPCVLVGVAKVPMTTETEVRRLLKDHPETQKTDKIV